MANILVGGVNLKTLGMHGGVANAKNYGALANDTYDNSGIVQALIDAWEALDGGTIVFPASQEGGRYRFTTGVINDSVNVVNFVGTGGSSRLYTQGQNSSVLWLDNATADASLIKYAYTAFHTGGQLIKLLHFMGRNASAGANQSAILFAGRCDNHAIENCGFESFTGYAIAHDPTIAETYNQNSSCRNCHFWSVAGIFGPTEEYPAAGAYLFNTLYTFDNVGLDGGVYGSGFTKPHIIDIRATRNVSFLGNTVIEGTGVAGYTSSFAMASASAEFDHIHYEIAANDPTYMFAIYGNGTGQFQSTPQKQLKINSLNIEAGVPIWIENLASNELLIDIDTLGSYDATSVADLFEWEDGIGANTSGTVSVRQLDVKVPFKVPDNYFGRLSIGMSGSDHQSRVIQTQRARRLLAWNPSMGSLIRDWGQVAVTISGSSATTAIEADGTTLCQRFTATVAAAFPVVIFTVYGDAYEGATTTILIRCRATIDAGDTGVGRIVNGAGLTQADWYNDTNAGFGFFNSTDYETVSATGVMPDTGVDPNRTWSTGTFGTLTVAAVWRVAAVEVWLGHPEHYDLATVGVPTVPTFANADATPSVAGFKTWTTFTAGLTITDLDDFPAGEERTIISKGAIVYDTTGTNLVGSSVDITTASGDITRWVSEDGTTKRLMAFVDVSVDNSAGA